MKGIYKGQEVELIGISNINGLQEVFFVLPDGEIEVTNIKNITYLNDNVRKKLDIQAQVADNKSASTNASDTPF